MSKFNRRQQNFSTSQETETPQIEVTEEVDTISNVEEVVEEVIPTSKVEEVVEEVKQVTEAQASPVVVQEVKREGVVVQGIIDQLNDYYDKMKPGLPVDTTVGSRNQYQLFTIINAILNNKNSEEFRKLYAALLNFAREHRKDVFKEEYINRFLREWPGTDNEFKIFTNMTYLIIETVDSKTLRELKKYISFDKLLENFNETQKKNILSYYA